MSITRQECADWINANISTELTSEEITTLRTSIENFASPKLLSEALINVFGDITMLVEIRDNN